MKKILLVITLLFFMFNVSVPEAAAKILRVDGARVHTIWVYDQQVRPDSFVAFFNKTAGDEELGNCQGAWVDTTKSYADHALQVLLSAFESNAQVNYQMDSESPWREREAPLRCEMIFVAIKP